MTFKAAQEALTQYVKDNWPSDIPMFYENGPVPNVAELAGEFATFEVDIEASQQADIGNNPVNRYYGAIYFTFFQPEGTGTSFLSDSFDWVNEHMSNRRFGIATCRTSAPINAPEIPGWYGKTIKLPFFYYH